MKLKMVEVNGKSYAEVQDGLPVYLHDDGKEVPFDAVSAVSKISALNGEAMGNRQRYEAAEANLKKFDGLEPDKARAALDTLTKIDQKKLVDAGEIDKVRNEIKAAFEAQYQPIAEKAVKLENALNAELIGGAFAKSAFVKDKLAVPVDMVQAAFGQQMKVEDGKLVAYDQAGQKIYSKSRPGELAGFDEALEVIVNAYPNRDHILKGANQSGAGTTASARQAQPAGKTVSRAQWDTMSQTERMEASKAGTKVVDAA